MLGGDLKSNDVGIPRYFSIYDQAKTGIGQVEHNEDSVIF
jgi:hypothetical protein